MTLEWTEISKTPTEHKEYLVQYTEYLGIIPITGWKISLWDGAFHNMNRQIITHYTDIPEYFYENRANP